MDYYRAAAALAEMDVKGISQSVFSTAYPNVGGMASSAEFDASAAALQSGQTDSTGGRNCQANNSFQVNFVHFLYNSLLIG
jgi:hypothetical protein